MLGIGPAGAAPVSLTLTRLCRYPVKGLGGEELEMVAVAEGRGFPLDRHLALIRGKGRTDQSVERWMRRRSFATLLHFASLAHLDASANGVLRVRARGSLLAEGAIEAPAVHRTLEAEVARHLGLDPAASPFRVGLDEAGYVDVASISIIHLASLRALEAAVGRPLDQRRFRANLYLDGGEPWVERSWVGRRLLVGDAVLRVVEPTPRCAVTNIDPDTGCADLNLPFTLQRELGCMNVGVYAEVISAGRLSLGDAAVLQDI